jgi:hypothetical protein
LGGWTDLNVPFPLALRTVPAGLEYLSLLGGLTGIKVSRLLEELAGNGLEKLRYVDVTDEQTTDQGRPVLRASSHVAEVEHQERDHPDNQDSPEVAKEAFQLVPQLRRICFVRWRVGQAYLRGYPDAVAESAGYVSTEIKDVDMLDIPGPWREGVPVAS